MVRYKCVTNLYHVIATVYKVSTILEGRREEGKNGRCEDVKKGRPGKKTNRDRVTRKNTKMIHRTKE